jgi:hypothetical protein
MKAPERRIFHIRSRGCDDAIWKCVRDSIRRDPKLIGDPQIQAYVLNVIVNTK